MTLARGVTRVRWEAPYRTGAAWTSSCGMLDLELTMAQIFSVNMAGPVDKEIRKLTEHPDVMSQIQHWDPEIVARNLRETGEWTEEELNDHWANIERTLWTVCWELRDSYRCCWV